MREKAEAEAMHHCEKAEGHKCAKEEMKKCEKEAKACEKKCEKEAKKQCCKPECEMTSPHCDKCGTAEQQCGDCKDCAKPEIVGKMTKKEKH